MCGSPAGTRCAADTRASADRTGAAYWDAHPQGEALDPIGKATSAERGRLRGLRARRSERRAQAATAELHAMRAAREAREADALAKRVAAQQRAVEREARMKPSASLSARVSESLWRNEVLAG